MLLKILIINENDSFCSFLSGFLASLGHETSCCRGDRDGLRMVSSWQPELIILEASRPEIGVLDIMHRLQRLDESLNIPVIVISDCPELEFEMLGAFDFIHKPIDMIRLREDIELLGKGRKKPRQIRREPFEESEFQNFSDFLVLHSGLHFERRNLKALERGVINRMTALKIGSYREYYEYLEQYQESRQELQKLLHFLTVGETFFFRYHAHFKALQRFLVSEYSSKPHKKLRFWSAGCSTGEEPYSLAITIMEAFPDWRKRDITIHATDINNRSLKRAREGVYGRWAMRVMEERYLARYFDRVGDSYILHDEVKNLVQFSHLNLQTGRYHFEEGNTTLFDAVFCRNVMIYFTQATTRIIVDRITANLHPGGHLFLGHSEMLSHHSSQFERQVLDGAFYYRKKSDAAVPQQLAEKAAQKHPGTEVPKSPATSAAKRKESVCTPEMATPPAPPVEESTETLFERAQLLFDEEKYVDAAKLIDELLRRTPLHGRALVMRGFVLANDALFEDALAVCDQALAADDLLPEAYFLKGLVLDMIEDPVAAMDEYRKAILLKMDFVMPHYQLGRLYIRSGRMKDGMRELRNSLRILEKWGEERIIPYSGGLSREVFLGQLRGELEQVA